MGGRGNIEREGPAGDKKKQRDPILNRISPNEEEEEAASRRTTDLVAGPFTERSKEAIVSQSENCKLEITASAGNCLPTKVPLRFWITRPQALSRSCPSRASSRALLRLAGERDGKETTVGTTLWTEIG